MADPNFEEWAKAFAKRHGRPPTHEDIWQAGRDFQRSKPAVTADATRRTPADYAIEHAEYMAKDAERLLEAMTEHAAALMAREEEGDPDTDADISSLTERCEQAEQVLGESMGHLRNGIHEFRKRRDRALGAPNGAPREASPAAVPPNEPNEPLWNRKGNVIHAAVDRLGAARRAAATPIADPELAPSGMAAPGTWVCDGDRIAKVREAHAPTKFDPAGCYDLVLYARDGERIGRETPAMGGPRGYEPFCDAGRWRAIENPRFPLPRYGELDGHVRFTLVSPADAVAESASQDDGGAAPRP
jgi:hypothetical protein